MDIKSFTYSSYFLLFIICIVFISCDPHSSFKKSVQNNSSTDIRLMRYNKAISKNGSYVPQDSFLIKANSTKVLVEGGTLGDAPQCGSFDDSLFFRIEENSELKINLDLNDASSWTREKKGSHIKGYHVECRITITDADIVPK